MSTGTWLVLFSEHVVHAQYTINESKEAKGKKSNDLSLNVKVIIFPKSLGSYYTETFCLVIYMRGGRFIKYWPLNTFKKHVCIR